MPPASPSPPVKPLSLAPAAVEVRPLPGGGMVLRSRHELPPHAASVGELLRRAAETAPGRTFLAERDASGGWRRVTYAACRAAVERIAQALLARGLGRGRPVAILSENGIDHALLLLAAMEVGVPAAPISPAYSLLSRDHAKLRYILQVVRPGLVYAADGERFGAALAAALPAGEAGEAGEAAAELPAGAAASGAELVVSDRPPRGRAATPFADLLAAPAAGGAGAGAGAGAGSAEVAARAAGVGPDTVAKILFTSGSTGHPKGVINTQRMLCSNQQAIAATWRFLGERPPVIVDWLPWSHTFGGNHNFNMVLHHAGTLYIDAGKPAPGAIETTVANLREVPSTLHLNVPRGFDALVPYLARDRELRETFFRDLDALFYAAAALPPHLWNELARLSAAATGRRVAMLAAWGSTETAPCATQVHFPIERAGVIGLPVAGTEIKLAPAGDKLELRVKGPNVTPGYWPPADAGAGAGTSSREGGGCPFDEDGFLATGDAGRLADPADPARGLVFDGRLAENFKLLSGTWVQVGELRTDLLTATEPLVQDAVVTGHDRDGIGLLLFPNLAACRALCPDLAPDAPPGEVVGHPAVRARLAAALAAHNAANPGGSRRVTRVLFLMEPPSIDAGEITDKGYINQRAVLARRAAQVESLHGAPPGPGVLDLEAPS